MYYVQTDRKMQKFQTLELGLSNVCLTSFPTPLLPPVSSQLEESEFTCATSVKARKGMELEIEDLHIQMEDVVKLKISVSFDIC